MTGSTEDRHGSCRSWSVPEAVFSVLLSKPLLIGQSDRGGSGGGGPGGDSCHGGKREPDVRHVTPDDCGQTPDRTENEGNQEKKLNLKEHPGFL